MLALTGSAAALPARSAAIFATAAPLQPPEAAWPSGTVRLVARDAALYEEGAPAQHWYRLTSGSMRVFRVLHDGRRHVSEFVFPGQVFGVEPGPHHGHGAEAIEPASVVAYSLERLEQRLAQEPAARQAIRALLMDRLAAAQQRILLLGRLNATGRLAAFLLTMAQRLSKANPAGRVAELAMGRLDIADYLGLTVETVSRLFTALRSRGAIRLATANRVEILDPAALGRACGGTVDAGAPALARCA